MNTLKRALIVLALTLFSFGPAFAQQTAYSGVSVHGPFTNTTGAPAGLAQMLGANYEEPFVTAGATGYAQWTAGRVYIDGHTAGGIYIPASSASGVALDASKTSCVYPAFTTCDIVYANSSGVVGVTTAIATAKAAGATPLAYIETNSSAVPTKITYPYQLTVGQFPINLATDVTGSLVTPTFSANTIPAAATLTLTAAQSGSTVLMGATTGEVITLPTPAAGVWYDVIVTVSNTSNSNEIQTGASQFLVGSAVEGASAAATSIFLADGSTIRALKCNGTTTGGLIGSEYRIQGISSTVWQITGTNIASGTIATPFTGTP